MLKKKRRHNTDVWFGKDEHLDVQEVTISSKESQISLQKFESTADCCILQIEDSSELFKMTQINGELEKDQLGNVMHNQLKEKLAVDLVLSLERDKELERLTNIDFSFSKLPQCFDPNTFMMSFNKIQKVEKLYSRNSQDIDILVDTKDQNRATSFLDSSSKTLLDVGPDEQQLPATSRYFNVEPDEPYVETDVEPDVEPKKTSILDQIFHQHEDSQLKQSTSIISSPYVDFMKHHIVTSLNQQVINSVAKPDNDALQAPANKVKSTSFTDSELEFFFQSLEDDCHNKVKELLDRNAAASFRTPSLSESVKKIPRTRKSFPVMCNRIFIDSNCPLLVPPSTTKPSVMCEYAKPLPKASTSREFAKENFPWNRQQQVKRTAFKDKTETVTLSKYF